MCDVHASGKCIWLSLAVHMLTSTAMLTQALKGLRRRFDVQSELGER